MCSGNTEQLIPNYYFTAYDQRGLIDIEPVFNFIPCTKKEIVVANDKGLSTRFKRTPAGGFTISSFLDSKYNY